MLAFDCNTKKWW